MTDAIEPAPPSRDELWTLYKSAIEDMRFQVNLNWDRTKHYFLFNFGLFTAAGALQQALGPRITAVMLFAVFLNAAFAVHSIRRGHEYYRQARKRLKQIERKLALEDAYLLATTRGMVRENEGRTGMSELFNITHLAIALQVFVACAAFAVFIVQAFGLDPR